MLPVCSRPSRRAAGRNLPSTKLSTRLVHNKCGSTVRSVPRHDSARTRSRGGRRARYCAARSIAGGCPVRAARNGVKYDIDVGARILRKHVRRHGRTHVCAGSGRAPSVEGPESLWCEVGKGPAKFTESSDSWAGWPLRGLLKLVCWANAAQH
eukprot:scaffold1470_cov384-Prasinococcus_capsulatus_cf.AAC.7